MGVEGVGVCGQNICYQGAAFVIPFYLIYNMNMFGKADFRPIDLTPKFGGIGGCQ